MHVHIVYSDMSASRTQREHKENTQYTASIPWQSFQYYIFGSDLRVTTIHAVFPFHGNSDEVNKL